MAVAAKNGCGKFASFLCTCLRVSCCLGTMVVASERVMWKVLPNVLCICLKGFCGGYICPPVSFAVVWGTRPLLSKRLFGGFPQLLSLGFPYRFSTFLPQSPAALWCKCACLEQGWMEGCSNGIYFWFVFLRGPGWATFCYICFQFWFNHPSPGFWRVLSIGITTFVSLRNGPIHKESSTPITHAPPPWSKSSVISALLGYSLGLLSFTLLSSCL